jgi:hypothetical protein
MNLKQASNILLHNLRETNPHKDRVFQRVGRSDGKAFGITYHATNTLPAEGENVDMRWPWPGRYAYMFLEDEPRTPGAPLEIYYFQDHPDLNAIHLVGAYALNEESLKVALKHVFEYLVMEINPTNLGSNMMQ